MRDFMGWSVPLFRVFGITVRLHFLYILITLILIIAAVSRDKDNSFWWEFVLVWVVMLFVCVLLHELGHCFAARSVGGDANEILIWPLGGLAYTDLPNNPRAHFISTAGGPAVNLGLSLVAATALLSASYVPPLNPFNFDTLYYPELYNWKAEKSYIGSKDVRWVNEKGERIEGHPAVLQDGSGVVIVKEFKAWHARPDLSLGRLPDWTLWVSRFFWLNWVLFLFNLVPAIPLDGGRMLQTAVWARSDSRHATVVTAYTGFAVALVFFVISLFTPNSLLFFAAMIIIFFSYRSLALMEMEGGDSFMGYDFSQGYTSLERGEEEEPKPRPKKRPGPIARWLQARRARRLQREAEQRAADEARLDELLDKIHRQGKESLTDEERRFMDRVSGRYRNRS